MNIDLTDQSLQHYTAWPLKRGLSAVSNFSPADYAWWAASASVSFPIGYFAGDRHGNVPLYGIFSLLSASSLLLLLLLWVCLEVSVWVCVYVFVHSCIHARLYCLSCDEESALREVLNWEIVGMSTGGKCRSPESLKRMNKLSKLHDPICIWESQFDSTGFH
jgi:hypothetical protein